MTSPLHELFISIAFSPCTSSKKSPDIPDGMTAFSQSISNEDGAFALNPASTPFTSIEKEPPLVFRVTATFGRIGRGAEIVKRRGRSSERKRYIILLTHA